MHQAVDGQHGMEIRQKVSITGPEFVYDIVVLATNHNSLQQVLNRTCYYASSDGFEINVPSKHRPKQAKNTTTKRLQLTKKDILRLTRISYVSYPLEFPDICKENHDWGPGSITAYTKSLFRRPKIVSCHINRRVVSSAGSSYLLRTAGCVRCCRLVNAFVNTCLTEDVTEVRGYNLVIIFAYFLVYEKRSAVAPFWCLTAMPPNYIQVHRPKPQCCFRPLRNHRYHIRFSKVSLWKVANLIGYNIPGGTYSSSEVDESLSSDSISGNGKLSVRRRNN
ncbi:hypothetical protein CLF_100510 [Clonorchis sinensis]|uniref:Uncharacterized protein n=1 Tax=Clonorchis sinensis TaxID=79923 RepID=G7Y3M6_CLOSI|nr:hypothetical protein CLF_100510 [Clonorchis sinensis]